MFYCTRKELVVCKEFNFRVGLFMAMTLNKVSLGLLGLAISLCGTATGSEGTSLSQDGDIFIYDLAEAPATKNDKAAATDSGALQKAPVQPQTTPLAAEEDEDDDEAEDTYCPPPICPPCCYESCYEPCVVPCQQPCTCFCVWADLLYWRSALGGLETEFGPATITKTLDSDNIPTTRTHESDEDPDFDWKAGFRLGAAYDAACWDLTFAAYWTHIHGGANWVNGCASNGSWKMEYDTLDFIVGRQYDVGCCITLTPYLGVRWAHVHQNLGLHIETPFTNNGSEGVIVSTREDQDKFWGYGPEGGLAGTYALPCNFSLYADATALAYYGKADTDYDHSDVFPTSVELFQAHQKQHDCWLALDFAIGLRWEQDWCCKLFALQLGFEQHRILDFNNFCNGDLCLDGVTLRGQICF